MDAVFLDTGILLRLLQADDPFHAVVKNAVRTLRRSHCAFFTSFQNVAEFWNVSTRPASARGGLGLDVSTVERRVQTIDRWCKVLVDTDSSYFIWRQLVKDHSVSGTSEHDARLVATMLAHGMNRIVTLNDRHFRRYEPDGITIVMPQSLAIEPE